MPKYDFNNVAKKLLTVAASDSCWMITFSFPSSNLYQKTKRNAKIKKNKQKKSQLLPVFLWFVMEKQRDKNHFH